jgi:hypothetical protein
MKRVLIVAPHFPPVDAADMHRARVSAEHFSAFGWKPHVLTVAPECQEMPVEPPLVETLPAELPVTRTRAWSPRWTRRLGVGSVGLRAFAHLYRAGARVIARESIDLVYFSTTVFPVMALGRLWKRRFGVPYVLDIQDAWLSEYYDDKPASARPPKYAWARTLHATLEPWTMKTVDGLIAVSPAYIATLRRRYPWIAEEMTRTVPFGASSQDFEVAKRLSWRNPIFDAADGRCHGVAVGRGGKDMRVAATILFRAFRAFARVRPDCRVHLAFVGTDYAPAARARPTIAPVAEIEAIADRVTEHPARVPYFDGLRLLLDASFLVVLGSDDPEYSPSKVYPYILAKRPIVAVLHSSSPVADLITRTRAGIVVTFDGEQSIDAAAERLAARLVEQWPAAPAEPGVDWSAFEPYSARELTRRQCEVFDACVRQQAAAAEVPCPG